MKRVPISFWRCSQSGILGGMLGLMFLASLLVADDATNMLLFPEAMQTFTYADPASLNARCYAGDLLKDKGGVPDMAAARLAPGLYTADFHLRVSHTADRYVARMGFTISAQQNGKSLGSRTFSLIAFETPGTYQDFRLFFTVEKAGKVRFQTRYVWAPIRGQKRPYPLDSIKASSTISLTDSDSNRDTFALEHELKEIPWHLTLDRIALSPVSEVIMQNLAVDKIRYLPGASAAVSGRLVNFSGSTRRVTVVTEFICDMDAVQEVNRQSVTLPAGSRQGLAFTSPVLEARWGREVRVRVLEGTRELFRTSEYFTVHDNPWAVAIGSYGINLSYYRAGVKGEKCANHANAIKRNYGNTVEFVFWAEDDFGGLTPTNTPYWSGQMRHEGGAESTRQLIRAFHDAGIACSFYSLYSVADGKAGYALFRKHPDWFRPTFYDVSQLDRWDRSSNLISWPRVSVRPDTPEPYRYHADEIIRSIESFGWDSIRYDTDMSVKEMVGTQPHVAKYFPETKRRVNAAFPLFQWGYNDALHRNNLEHDAMLRDLFETLCAGGGMIMDEYNVHAFQDRWTYEKYAGRHRYIRNQVHPLGGNVTFCPSDSEWTNDQVYQAILPLAARAHHAWDPHKGNTPYANYHQFSTRYAGALWDTAAILLPGAAGRIDWGASATNLFHWADYAYLRPRAEGRSDLVLHLINTPPKRVCSYNDNRVSLPLRNLHGAIKLPAGLKVRGVFATTAEPTLHQDSLAFTDTGGTLTFDVPAVRFWTMVVVELEGQGEWQ